MAPATPTDPSPQPPASTSRAASAASDTARVGVYLTPTEFDRARAGYLADWQSGGDADTFARWITAALETHAERTPRQRAEQTTPRPRAAERSGSSRSFTIPTKSVDRMRAAIGADQHIGRWPTVSAWCAEAINLAVQAAQTRAGGVLPAPPARLPNRLVRPTSDWP